jgi:hypothetical protein
MALSRVPNSQFRMATEETSPGLQVVDVVLWLFRRVVADKEIGPRGARLLTRVFQRGYQSDFSFDGVGSAVERKLDEIWNAPISDEQTQAGTELMAKSEENRIAAMRGYVAKKASEIGT